MKVYTRKFSSPESALEAGLRIDSDPVLQITHSSNGPATDLATTESETDTQPPQATATRTGMSLKTVQLIVGRLLTDEEYRLKFLSDPTRALTMLRDQGVELTSAELDALIRTDRTLWSDAAARIDPDLQRSSWLPD